MTNPTAEQARKVIVVWLRAIIYWPVLCPLIQCDYWMRQIGLREDKWFWADVLAMDWGYLGPWDWGRHD